MDVFRVLAMVGVLEWIAVPVRAVRRVVEMRLYHAGPCLTEVQVETSRIADGAIATFYGRCYQPRGDGETAYIAGFNAFSTARDFVKEEGK